jgi:hypothetical protein
LEAASEDAPLMLIQEAEDLLQHVGFKLVDLDAASASILAPLPPPCIVRTGAACQSLGAHSTATGPASALGSM